MLERERNIYALLQQSDGHPGLLRYYGRLDDCSVLSLAKHGSIREYRARNTQAVSLDTKLRWIQEIASTFNFIHDHGVIHCDISCNNVFLDEQLRTKVGDFAGSATAGEIWSSLYEISHTLPGSDDTPSTNSDRFALGSTFFEILSGKKPFQGLEACEIEQDFKRGRFPALDGLHCADIISKCWHEGYISTNALLSDVESESMSIYYLRRRSEANDKTEQKHESRLQPMLGTDLRRKKTG